MKILGVETFIEYAKFSMNKAKSQFKLNKLVFLGFILLVSIIFSGAISAAIVPVSPGTNAIKDAINTAHSGDTLQLSAGTYNEHNIMVNKSLTMRGPDVGVNNPPTAIIDAQKLGKSVHY